MSQLVVNRGGQDFYLGRVPSVYDRRNFAMEDLFDVSKAPIDKEWELGLTLDQGQTPSCTGHAARGWELALPIADKVDPNEIQVPDPRATEIWQRAQAIEFGHIDPNDGATIHGIAKALHEVGPLAVNGKPRMKTYVFAKSINSALYYLSYRGPLIIGISWYNSMFDPNTDGVIKVDASSGLAGGHAIISYKIDLANRLIWHRNSWSPNWGKNGNFALSFDDYNTLCFKEGGEVCAGVEQQVE